MGGPCNDVLVVEDDPDLREVYDRVLSSFYAVSTAGTGADALDIVTAETDVVLLDRRLPDMDFDDVLRELKAQCGDCYVALVTGVEPDFDIIELGIDDYLVKPVTTEQMCDAVERLCSVAEYDATYQELSQKRVKRSVLLQEKPPTELSDSEEFAQLCAEIERLEDELDEMVETVSETTRGPEQ